MAHIEQVNRVQYLEDGSYIVDIVADVDGDGTLEEVQFCLVEGDTAGLASDVSAAVKQWIENDSPVTAYVGDEPTPEYVNIERQRRIEAGFDFNNTTFDFNITSKTNISGAAQLAFMAIVAGAPEGYLKWHGAADDFSWIAKDNTLVTMDAQTTVAFGQAAAQHEREHIVAARALKDNDAIPLDYEDDKYWP